MRNPTTELLQTNINGILKMTEIERRIGCVRTGAKVSVAMSGIGMVQHGDGALGGGNGGSGKVRTTHA